MDSFDDKLRKQGEEIHEKAYDNQEKIKEIKKMFDELEISFDAIQDTKDMDHTQVARDIQKIKKILEDN